MRKLTFSSNIFFYFIVPLLVASTINYYDYSYVLGFNEHMNYLYLLIFFIAAALYVLLKRRRLINIEYPVLIIVWGFFLFNIIGIISTHFLVQVLPKIKVDIWKTIKYSCYGIAFLSLGIFTVTGLLKNKNLKPEQHFYVWDKSKLRLLIYILFLITLVSSIGYFMSGGDFVLLMENPSDVYQISSSTKANPLLSWMYHTGYYYLFTLTGVYLLLNKNDGSIWMIFCLSAVILGLTGSRTFLFIPAVTLLFTYHYYRKKLNIVKLATTGMILLLLFNFIGNVRSGTDDRKILESMIMKVSEFTTFSELVSKYPDGNMFDESLILKSFVLTAFPRQMWALIGIDKMKSLLIPGVEYNVLLRANPSYTSGVRIGFIGQLFMDFGLKGIILGMYIFGAILGGLNYMLSASNNKALKVLILNYILAIMLYAIVGQSNVVFSFFYYGMYEMFVIYLICRRKELRA